MGNKLCCSKQQVIKAEQDVKQLLSKLVQYAEEGVDIAIQASQADIQKLVSILLAKIDSSQAVDSVAKILGPDAEKAIVALVEKLIEAALASGVPAPPVPVPVVPAPVVP